MLSPSFAALDHGRLVGIRGGGRSGGYDTAPDLRTLGCARGFRAWSVLAWGDGEVATPSWRRLWWWILLSYLVLFAGIAAGRVIQQVLLR